MHTSDYLHQIVYEQNLRELSAAAAERALVRSLEDAGDPRVVPRRRPLHAVLTALRKRWAGAFRQGSMARW